MRREGGFVVPALVWQVLPYVLGAIALWGAYAYVDRSWETKAGISKGKQLQDQVYAKRDNEALKKALAEQERLRKAKEAAETESARLTGIASANYQKGLTDGKAEVDTAVARVRAGQRLRDPGRTVIATDCPGAAVPQAGTGASGRDGQAGAELSAAASEFLLRLAGEADDRVKQLTACQAIVAGDRR